MILDTNILIAHLNGEVKVVETISRWKRDSRPLFISSISFAETLALPLITPRDAEKIRAFLLNFISISFDNATAEHAAMFKRKYRLNLPDAAIAATAVTRSIPLVTRDRTFRKIRELTVIEI